MVEIYISVRFYVLSEADQGLRCSQMLLDIHANMKRIVRAIEAIPLHLNTGNWAIKAGDHLSQAMVVPKLRSRRSACIISSCDGSLLHANNGERTW